MPDTNHVSRAYNVPAILQFQFMPHVMLFPMLNVLYFYISTYRSLCTAPSMAVFCNSLILCFPSLSLRFFLNNFEIVPVAPFTYIYIFVCVYVCVRARGFKTFGDAFRLPYSIAFCCSIRPFLDLLHSWLYISHLSRFFGTASFFPPSFFQLVMIYY